MYSLQIITLLFLLIFSLTTEVSWLFFYFLKTDLKNENSNQRQYFFSKTNLLMYMLYIHIYIKIYKIAIELYMYISKFTSLEGNSNLTTKFCLNFLCKLNCLEILVVGTPKGLRISLLSIFPLQPQNKILFPPRRGRMI